MPCGTYSRKYPDGRLGRQGKPVWRVLSDADIQQAAYGRFPADTGFRGKQLCGRYPDAERYCFRISENVYEADSEQRKSLHLAAVFTCNFTNHMYALAAGLLKKYGLPFEVMLPLIDETARKVHELEPRLAQTGPAVRYDENVIGEHLQMLSDEPDMQELYRLISESIHRQNS